METTALAFSWNALQPRGFLLWEAFHKYLKKVANASARSAHVQLASGVGGGRKGLPRGTGSMGNRLSRGVTRKQWPLKATVLLVNRAGS